MYKFLSKNFYNTIILNYNKKTVTINFLNKDLKKVGSYILNLKYTIQIDNIYNILCFNNNFKSNLKKLDYKIYIQIIKNR